MKLFSTNKKQKNVSLKEAVLKGLADDGGLFMPEKIPKLPKEFFQKIEKLSFQEIALEVSKKLVGNSVPNKELKKIINDSINFDSPLIELEKNIYSLELFHGPTLAFKDFGARFMARLMAYFLKNSKQEMNILVATSGDTGSAVAHGFLNVPKFKVSILYPTGKVSHIQEQQLTTMGGNITAYEVNGTFDDCQKLVKEAFMDKDLKNLSSANSINIARLIPQTFYYFYAYAQIKKIAKSKNPKVIFSVPSGNFGNLTAGLITKKMGLPVHKFIAAVNANDIFPKYLKTGKYQSKPSVKTISNAMDVGNPSNFARIISLYQNNLAKIKKDIYSQSFTDKQTSETIRSIYKKTGYILDPHGTVAYLGIKAYNKKNPQKNIVSIFLETAHPAKFADIVEPIIEKQIKIPHRLATHLKKKKSAKKISTKFEELKKILIELE